MYWSTLTQGTKLDSKIESQSPKNFNTVTFGGTEPFMFFWVLIFQSKFGSVDLTFDQTFFFLIYLWSVNIWGGVLEVLNLTYKLLMGFWLSLEGKGSKDQCHKKKKNNNKNPTKIYNKGAY